MVRKSFKLFHAPLFSLSRRKEKNELLFRMAYDFDGGAALNAFRPNEGTGRVPRRFFPKISKIGSGNGKARKDMFL